MARWLAQRPWALPARGARTGSPRPRSLRPGLPRGHAVLVSGSGHRDGCAGDGVIARRAVGVADVDSQVDGADRRPGAVPVVGRAGAIALHELPGARAGGPDPELVDGAVGAARGRGGDG